MKIFNGKSSGKFSQSDRSNSTMMLALMSLSAAVLLTSCQGGDTKAKAEGLKLGSLSPATGDLASIGQNWPPAVQLAVDTVNQCGGVNEAQVSLTSEDDQTDPGAGTSAMTKLAEVDRVAGVVGSFASSVSGAAVDVAVRNKVMMVSPGSTSPVFTER
ncbi:MAG: hypothetical protein RLZZ74_972, partial [Cyanobacteriota bacterium]